RRDPSVADSVERGGHAATRAPQLVEDDLRTPAFENFAFGDARQQRHDQERHLPAVLDDRPHARKRSASPGGGSGAPAGRSRRQARHAEPKHSAMPSQRTPSKSSARIAGACADTTEL